MTTYNDKYSYDIKPIENSYIIPYQTIEHIIYEHFDDVHLDCELAGGRTDGQPSILSVLSGSGVNDVILKHSITVQRSTDDYDDDERLWGVEMYKNGHSDLDYYGEDGIIGCLLCQICDDGKIEPGNYYIKVSY